MSKLILPRRNLIVPVLAAGLAAASPVIAAPALILSPAITEQWEKAGVVAPSLKTDPVLALLMMARAVMVDQTTSEENVTTWSATDKDATYTLSNLNKTASGTTNNREIRSNLPLASKKYLEFFVDTANGNAIVGVADATCPLTTNFVLVNSGIGYGGGGQVYQGPSGTILATLAAHSNGDRVMMAVDPASSLIWFGKNGTWSGNPSAGTGGFPLAVPSGPFFAILNAGAPSTVYTINGGDTAFTYTPPTGFL
jgi:hypothetical protein